MLGSVPRLTSREQLDSVASRLPGVVRGNSSVGRAQPCQGWGRGFESRFPLWTLGLALGKGERDFGPIRHLPSPFPEGSSLMKVPGG